MRVDDGGQLEPRPGRPGMHGGRPIGTGELVIGEWSLTAAAWTDRHDHEEVNWVLDGELHVTCDGRSEVVRAGHAVVVPAGSTARYAAPVHARMLYVYGPSADGHAVMDGRYEELAGTCSAGRRATAGSLGSRGRETRGMEHTGATARAIWQRLELIHDVTYFSAEARQALVDAGYRGFWMGYFAGRAAPLGAVGPEVVTALFYNFAPSRVRKALPDAWSFAAPDVALEARRRGSVAALRRALGDAADGPDVATAAELAARAARSASVDGRALFAANAALPWPEDPLEVLWHAATLLREHRGDGHVALLTASGLTGRESNVFQSAAGNTPREILAIARDYDDAEWSALTASLVDRRLVDGGGRLTDAGQDLRRELEARTDDLGLQPYLALDGSELDRLHAAATAVSRAVVATGDLPAMTPMGATLTA